jgi:hypothetical protein
MLRTLLKVTLDVLVRNRPQMTTISLQDDLVALMREVDEPVDRVAQEMIVLELYRRRIISGGRLNSSA